MISVCTDDRNSERTLQDQTRSCHASAERESFRLSCGHGGKPMRCPLSVANAYLALASLLELLASVESQENARMTGRDMP